MWVYYYENSTIMTADKSMQDIYLLKYPLLKNIPVQASYLRAGC